MSLKSKLLSSFVGSGVTAAINMLTTIFILRWFGEDIFSNYIINLSYVALATILLELIPGNYAVFKLQDSPSFIYGFALFALIISTVNFLIVYILTTCNLFFVDTNIFIGIYASLISLKRYFDIKFQADGLVNIFFKIESSIALTKLIFIYLGNKLFQNSEALWTALCISIAIPYGIWLSTHRNELQILSNSINKKSLHTISQNKKHFYAYYLGTVLKRLKDNLITIASPIYLEGTQGLANFLLAYRGLVFAIGQIRVLEAILNNKLLLDAAQKIKRYHVLLLALLAQLACIAATLVIAYFSKISSFDYRTIVLLSCVCWVYVFFTQSRVKALSKYKQSLINGSYLTYLTTIAVLVACTFYLNLASANLLAVSTFFAELLSCLVIVFLLRHTK